MRESSEVICAGVRDISSKVWGTHPGIKANVPRGRHCWSFMERNQGFGCILSASSDRTMEGVITHDCMANWKFAGIVFSEG